MLGGNFLPTPLSQQMAGSLQGHLFLSHIFMVKKTTQHILLDGVLKNLETIFELIF